jgi:hypothetical protein
VAQRTFCLDTSSRCRHLRLPHWQGRSRGLLGTQWRLSYVKASAQQQNHSRSSLRKPSFLFIPIGTKSAFQSLQSDYNSLWEPNKICLKIRKPFDHPPKLVGFDKRVEKSLFSQDYGGVLLDEGQDFRNPGSKHSAALLILDHGGVRIVATATPLQTRAEVRYLVDPPPLTV